MMNHNNNDYLERLVDTLMFAFRIQNDDSLIGILEEYSEKSNRDALREWIKKTLLNPDLWIAESILPILIDRFEQAIDLTQSNK